MVASAAIVRATNDALKNSDVRARVRAMHAGNMPLLDMVAALGLSDEMTSEIRVVIQGLLPDVVASIRRATLETLDKGGADMPIDCGITDAAELANGVDVGVVGHTIVVRPS